MNFMDNMGKKLKQSGQNVFDKAKNMTELSSVENVLSKEEIGLNKLYAELGERFFKAMNTPYPEEYADVCEKIAAASERLEKFQKEKNRLKNVVVCPSCGTECPQGSAFCSGCGSPLPAPVAALGMKFCVGCGKEIPEEAVFCRFCGTKNTVEN